MADIKFLTEEVISSMVNDVRNNHKLTDSERNTELMILFHILDHINDGHTLIIDNEGTITLWEGGLYNA